MVLFAKFMKVKLIAVGLMVCLGVTTQRVNAQAELSTLLTYALEHSHTIKKAGLQQQESDQKYKEVRGQGLPQADGSASYSLMKIKKIDIPAELYTMVGSNYAPLLDELGNLDKLYSASAGMQVTQLIYSQSYWVGLKAAQKSKELYAILKSKSEEEIIEEVSSGYYQAASLMLQKASVEKSLQILNEMYRILNLNYKNDMVKETEVNRLKVNIINLEVTKETVQNGINSQVGYLKALVGMPQDSIIRIDTAAIVKGYGSSSPISGFKVENVPAYGALLKQLELGEYQLKISKATYLPTLAAFGKFTYSSYNTKSTFSTWNPMTTIGLNLSIPIFTSGVNKAKIAQNRLKISQINEDIYQANDMLRLQYDNAVRDFQTAQRLLAAQGENKSLAQKVYRQTLLQYQENMASLADLLNVNADFLQADNSFNQQLLTCKVSEIKMLKASGSLKSLINKK